MLNREEDVRRSLNKHVFWKTYRLGYQEELLERVSPRCLERTKKRIRGYGQYMLYVRTVDKVILVLSNYRNPEHLFVELVDQHIVVAW